HPDITAGTIGARVIGAGGALFALSNNHVYANQNNAVVGNAVIQPGDIDGGVSPGDDIGTLSAFQEIFFDGSDNVIDAAIATVATVNEGNGSVLTVGNSTPLGGYGTPSSTPVVAVVGMDVTKYGRTTGQTESQISGINAIVNVGYTGGTARFVNQVIVSGGKFSDGGDSGSLIVTSDGLNPVALLFAGSRTATIGNPIGPVLAAFGVSIDGSGPAPDPPATGSISGTVTNSDGGAGIGGATVSSAGQSTTTAGNGSYLLEKVPVTTTSVTASASGFASSTVPVSVDEGMTTAQNFSLAAVQTGEMTVGSITYTETGGKNSDKDLRVTLSVVDTSNNVGIEGASISISLNFSGNSLTGTGSTGADGTVTFRLRNAPSDTYTTVVTNVVATDFVWDGNYPANEHTK
ncbi:MAG: carboxypeptidase regulatory-like domain-containing protein, partial [Chloroflexi bacterium]|nr:carboxypeptidase regulatory-like domain-containing protein [Chloroflexota bacterium]